MIRRARRRSPGAVVAACGCYVQTHTDEAKTLGIDLIGGTGDRMAFLDLLEQEVRDRTPRVAVDDSLRRRSFEVLPAGGLAARTRAMLKVEDGCVNFCTYCIIPFARGPVRSLPLDQAVAQTRQLQAEGYRELVFTGIEISSWGQDLHNGSSPGCGCGWAVWSPGPSPRTSAVGRRLCPTCAPISTCPCSPAATPPCIG